MGNLKKFTRASCSAVIGEAMRVDDKVLYNPENHQIDYDLSHLNYSVMDVPDEGLERYNRRLSEVFCQNREDVNTLVTWVWTMPKDLDPEHEREFFKGIYDFFKEKHGEENIIYARVHKDETSPHLQLGFIPVVAAPKKKQGYKVCAKEVSNKAYLNSVHSDLQIYLENRLGVECNILTGESIGLSLDEWKKQRDLVREIGELTQVRDSLKEEVKELNEEITEKKGLLTKIKDFIMGHPNFFEMFLHWLHPDLDYQKRKEVLKGFTEYSERLAEERKQERDYGMHL